jgi:hypothetical protein
MKPGRELDALIAERVMGWTIISLDILSPEFEKRFGVYRFRDSSLIGTRASHNFPRPVPIPYYSTEITSAWEIWSKIREMGYWVELKQVRPRNIPSRQEYQCEIFSNDFNKSIALTIRSTEPLAICIAALQALGVELP